MCLVLILAYIFIYLSAYLFMEKVFKRKNIGIKGAFRVACVSLNISTHNLEGEHKPRVRRQSTIAGLE